MEEFEISIKSAPHGSVVTVQGSTPTIVVEFGILANNISEKCGIPRELLMMAVMKGAEMEREISSGSVCIDKGAIERREPNFVCHAAITKAQAQKEEADSLLDKVFGGSAELLFASILSDRPLSKEEAARLRALVEEYEA